MIVLFFVLIGSSNFLAAQAPLSRYQQITSTYGLPSDYVFDISFDEKGFAWLATNEGLVRYDGKNFRIYKNTKTEQEDIDWYVRHLLIQKDKIWFTLNNGQLYYLDREALDIHSFPVSYPGKSISRKYPYSFLRSDSNGNVWLGIEQTGLIKIQEDIKEVELFDSSMFPILRDCCLLDMDEDDLGNFYLATSKGLMFLSASHKTISFVGDEKQVSHKAVFSKTNSVLVDLAGFVWLGMAGDGLVKFSPESQKVETFDLLPDHEHIDGCFINQLFLGQDNQLWFHSKGALSSIRLDISPYNITSYPRGKYYDLLANKINKVVQSPNGSLWMATHGGGVNVLRREESRFLNIQFDPEFKQLFGLSIVDIVQEEGLLFLSTMEYGMMVFNENGNYKPKISKQINTGIHFNSGHRLYVEYRDYSLMIGNHEELLCYKIESQELTLLKSINYHNIDQRINSVHDVYLENEDLIWLMSDQGVFLIEDQELKKSIPTSSPVSCMIKDYRGNIWIGTDGSGIYMHQNAESSLVHYEHNNKEEKTLVGNEISTMLEDNTGVMWIGTLDGGLCFFDRNYKNFVKSVPSLNTIPNQYFSLIESNQDCLWAATSKGLYRIRLSTNEWTHFGHMQGFPSSVPHKNATYKGKDNNLLFGTESGLISFQPDRIVLADQFPSIEVTDFRIHNQSVLTNNSPYKEALLSNQEIILNPNENDFAIEFIALSIDYIDHIHYKYRMIGLDDEWLTSYHNNFTSYMNLKSGSYIFEVTCTNRDGIWNPNPIQLNILIKEAFYKQTWFRFVIPILGLLIILLISYIRIRLANRNARILSLKVEIKTKELEESNQKLLSEVEDRKSAEAEAESANKAKSEFVATLSHEIRSPMNSIIGYADVLSTVIEDEKQSHYLNSIRNSGRGLLELINDTLDLSKIEAGKLDLEYKSINIRHLIENIQQVFYLKSVEKELLLSYEIDPDIPNALVLCDTRLRQILINIVDNAIKFTEKGKVSILVKRRSPLSDQNKMDLSIEIIDTGIGIAQEQQEIIFNAFQQSEGQKYQKYGGTGLGLSICKSLMELMGGSIQLKSKAGEGTHFTLILNEVLISSEREQEKYEGSLHQLELQDQSILIVDDGKANRKIIKEFLRPTKAIILEAENGEKAIEIALEKKPNIIFLDIRMPVMSGVEAAQVLRSNPATSDIPLIAFTASISFNASSIYKNAGFDDVLLKPIQISELAEVIIEHLDIFPVEKAIIQDAITDYHKSSYENIKIIDLKSALVELDLLMDDWKYIHSNPKIESVLEFSNKIKQIGDNYGIQSIIGYYQKLNQGIESKDLNILKQDLNVYHHLLEELNAYLND